jgi:hypothetical protein
MPELEKAKFEERVVLVPPDRSDPVFGAQVAEEEEEDQGIGLVALHLEEAARRDLLAFGIDQVPEVLRLEEVARLRGGHPDRLAPPLADGRQRLDLLCQSLETIGWDAVKAVMDDSSHALSLPRHLDFRSFNPGLS